MPGVYREKVCPKCGVKHRKRGEYCSKTCSNKGRDQIVYEKHSEFMRSDEGRQIQLNNLKSLSEDELPSVGGITTNQPSGFVSGGDFWTSDNDW